jgi:DHA2 family multidrug resistance protein-like MFS transporter
LQNSYSEYALVIFLTGYMLFCLGVSPIGSLTTDIVISAAPPEKAGAASAISETSFEFGGAIGIAVLGSILTASYRTTIAKILPADISAAAAQTAQNTLGGAMTIAETLSAETGATLLHAAREAFTHSMQITAGLCAVVMLVTAFVTLKYLKRR